MLDSGKSCFKTTFCVNNVSFGPNKLQKRGTSWVLCLVFLYIILCYDGWVILQSPSDANLTNGQTKCLFQSRCTFFLNNWKKRCHKYVSMEGICLFFKSSVFKFLSSNFLSQVTIMPYTIYTLYNYKHLIFIALQIIHLVAWNLSCNFLHRFPT